MLLFNNMYLLLVVHYDVVHTCTSMYVFYKFVLLLSVEELTNTLLNYIHIILTTKKLLFI